MSRMFERQDRRTFNLKPRYWDPEITEEDKDTYIPNIRGRFTDMYEKRKANRRGYNGRYAVRLFLILIAVFLIILYLVMRYSEGGLKFLGL